MSELENAAPQPQFIPVAGQGPQGIAQLPLEFLCSAADEIERIEHFLRGEIPVRMSDREVQWCKKGTPLMSDEGIQWVLTVITSYLSKNTYLTDINENDVRFMCSEIADILRDAFVTRGHDMGIRKENFDLVKTAIVDQAYIALMRSKEALMLDFLASTTRQNVTQTMVQGVQKKPNVIQRASGLGLGKFL